MGECCKGAWGSAVSSHQRFAALLGFLLWAKPIIVVMGPCYVGMRAMLFGYGAMSCGYGVMLCGYESHVMWVSDSS